MSYNYIDKFNLLPHPFGDFIPEFAKYLVIGTFPAHKRNYEFYYSGDENRFWLALGRIFGKTFHQQIGLQAKKEREGFLEDHFIAMTDMHRTCYRKNNYSGDEHLYSVFLNDIVELIVNNQTIDTLIFTSRTDAIGALGLFKILLLQKGLEVPEFTLLANKVLYGKLKIQNRVWDIYVPYSPSKRLEDIPTDKLVSMYDYIFSD